MNWSNFTNQTIPLLLHTRLLHCLSEIMLPRIPPEIMIRSHTEGVAQARHKSPAPDRGLGLLGCAGGSGAEKDPP